MAALHHGANTAGPCIAGETMKQPLTFRLHKLRCAAVLTQASESAAKSRGGSGLCSVFAG